jgi:hypothetical protein
MTYKPTREELLLFVNGELDSEASEEILIVLAEDDESLEMVDQLWKENNVITLSDETTVDNLDQAAADDLERKLTDKIHRSDLTSNVLRLGTQAAGMAYWALVRPLVNYVAGDISAEENESEEDESETN